MKKVRLTDLVVVHVRVGCLQVGMMMLAVEYESVWRAWDLRHALLRDLRTAVVCDSVRQQGSLTLARC